MEYTVIVSSANAQQARDIAALTEGGQGSFTSAVASSSDPTTVTGYVSSGGTPNEIIAALVEADICDAIVSHSVQTVWETLASLSLVLHQEPI